MNEENSDCMTLHPTTQPMLAAAIGLCVLTVSTIVIDNNAILVCHTLSLPKE